MRSSTTPATGCRGHTRRRPGSGTTSSCRSSSRPSAELTYRLLPGMIERGYGRIINVASLAGLVPAPAGHTLYGASKAFLIKFSEALSNEVRRHNVHVTALCPGFTWSEFHDVTGHARADEQDAALDVAGCGDRRTAGLRRRDGGAGHLHQRTRESRRSPRLCGICHSDWCTPSAAASAEAIEKPDVSRVFVAPGLLSQAVIGAGAPDGGPGHGSRFCTSGNHEGVKCAVHAAAGVLVGVCAAYNIAASCFRRDRHLRINAACLYAGRRLGVEADASPPRCHHRDPAVEPPDRDEAPRA